jgi:hypothetical protein
MHALLLLSLGVTAQEPAAMQFKNLATEQRIAVLVYCERERRYENAGRPLILLRGSTVKLPLHAGYFQVVVTNQYGVERRARRVLSPGELDRMKVVPVMAPDSPNGPGPPDFAIEEDDGFIPYVP